VTRILSFREFLKLQIRPSEFISQQNIVAACDFIYKSDFFVKANRDHFGFNDNHRFIIDAPNISAIIMCRFKDGEIKQLLKQCASKYKHSYVVVQTLIGDDGFIDSEEIKSIPTNIRKIYSKNIKYPHPKLAAIPIGRDWRVTAQGCNDSFQRIHINTYSNLAYMNFSLQTNPMLRGDIYERFKHESWVTRRLPVNYREYELNHCEFVREMNQHKFCLSPAGITTDCYRTWDSLFAKSIPVIDNSEQMRHFSDLPIVYTRDWMSLSGDLLQEYFTEMLKSHYCIDKLFASYWVKTIRNEMDHA
jgi:hypothetical protein